MTAARCPPQRIVRCLAQGGRVAAWSWLEFEPRSRSRRVSRAVGWVDALREER